MMSEVTAVAWCPNDITRLVTCSDECVVRLWNMSYGKLEVSDKIEIDGKAETVKKDVLGIDLLFFSSILHKHSSPTQVLYSVWN